MCVFCVVQGCSIRGDNHFMCEVCSGGSAAVWCFFKGHNLVSIFFHNF